MKYKIVYFTLIILVFVVYIKYIVSSYEITYNIGEYKIKETYNKEKYEFIIDRDDYFIIDKYEKRISKKKLIKEIKEKKINEYTCYNIKFSNKENKVVCFKDGVSISYYLINDEEVKEYIKTLALNELNTVKEAGNFKYYNNLEENTYVAVWNYKGFYIMNGEELTELNLFETTKYDNSLCFNINKYLVLPNYEQNHEFDEFVKINLENLTYKIFTYEYIIDNDSYISGTFKNKGYLYDNKYEVLYEINLKNNKLNVIGNEEKGYFKIENNKLVSASKKEYKEKITYFDKNKSDYEISDSFYKVYNEDYKVKILESNQVKIIKEYKDKVYFIYEDDLYVYNGNELNKIFHYFELNFNSNNMVFIYIK